MKSKAYSTVILTALFLNVLSMPSQAATIAGTTCPKVGNTKTTGGVKYFCVKSGKKLVWNKGTAVKATPTPSKSATPTPSKSATPSQSATATPTPSKSAMPSQSATATPTPSKSAMPSQSATATPSPSKSASPSESVISGLTKLTVEEVKKHDSGTSCWSIVFDNVFDLTKWITKHPGGAEKIRAICGKDGTSSFQRQHDGDGSAARELSSFFIGKLGESIKL